VADQAGAGAASEPKRARWFSFGSGQPSDDTANRLSPLAMTVAVALIGGMVATLTYSAGGTTRNWSALSASAMIALASAAAGGFLGLLFGVPRSLGVEQPSAAGAAPGTGLPAIAANTNLEQISDWLTKIIVGVTLTQLGAIKRGAADLFNAMAPVLGDRTGTSAFVGSVVVYFAVVGFFGGWLYARLRLGIAMSSADAWLELKRRAERAGDHETAKAAGDAAATSVSQVTTAGAAQGQQGGELESLVAQYEQLRATMPFSPRRTAQMEAVVRRAKQLATTGNFTAQDARTLFELGTEGHRIIALALMEGNVNLCYFPCVLDAIKQSVSAFEQFHALSIANLMVSSLTAEERQQLQDALNDRAVQAHWATDTSRASIVDQILQRLGTLGGSSQQGGESSQQGPQGDPPAT
jgi:hypothetical protein